MKRKQIAALFFAVMLGLTSLAGCGSSGGDSDSDGSAQNPADRRGRIPAKMQRPPMEKWWNLLSWAGKPLPWKRHL